METNTGTFMDSRKTCILSHLLEITGTPIVINGFIADLHVNVHFYGTRVYAHCVELLCEVK